MSLTYDQMSELSIAFQEAHVPADRRRSTRVKQRIAAEISEYHPDGRPGRSFGVTIEDFSTTGVGMIHSGKLQHGGQYILEIPRPGQPPIKVLLMVVRSSETDGGMFATQMQASEILAGRTQPTQASVSGWVKLAAAILVAGIAATIGFFLL